MSAAKTNAQRQAEFRARKAAEQNATEVRGIYSKPEDHAKIKAYAKKIAKSTEKC